MVLFFVTVLSCDCGLQTVAIADAHFHMIAEFCDHMETSLLYLSSGKFCATCLMLQHKLQETLSGFLRHLHNLILVLIIMD